MNTRLFCLLFAFSLSASLFLSGCPWARETHFTSANTSGRGLPAPGATDGGAEGNGDGETPGAEAPEREVVEPDVIRRVGDALYVLNQHRGLSIVDLAQEKLLTQVPTYGYPRDLYVSGDRAYVLVGYANNYVEDAGTIAFGLGTRLYVVDISTPAEAAVVSSFDLEGDLVDSRLVGDVLYAVSAEFQWSNGGGVEVGGGGGDTGVVRKQTSASWVTSVNLAHPENIAVADELSFEGYGNVIQATNAAIFVASGDWQQSSSLITYIDISDTAGAIAVRGQIAVPGYINDRFKMDAYEGVLRVVSSTAWPNRDVFVSTVNLANPDQLVVLGETTIPNAAGETLFATRFDGPRAYVVTYFMVDPLFVLDLSDPAAPRVAGELQVPGWSTHIEPRGDRLIALGVDDTEGKRRVKVSLFDVTDPAAPAQVDVVSFGDDWTWSSAYGDVKSFTVLNDVLLVPFSGWDETRGSYERLQFVSWTPEDLTLRGAVELKGTILRSFRGEEDYYGVTTEQVAVIDGSNLGTPAVRSSITLAEYVADYQELASGVQVAVLSHYEQDTSSVRTIDAGTGQTLGELSLDFSNIVAAHVRGEELVLVTSGWEESGSYYRLVVIDCSTPQTPAIAHDLRLDVEPFWGGFWYDYGPGGGDVMPVTEAKDAMIWYPWWRPSNAVLFAGDYAALRCSKNTFDLRFGSTTPTQGIALVNLETGEWTATVGLGYTQIDSLDASGNNLYLTTKQDLGSDIIGRPMCAFYVQEISPAVPSIGPEANVPGAFLQYDAAQDVLVCEDWQYRDWYQVQRKLVSASWNGGPEATLIDELALPENTGSLLPRGAHLYYDAYGSEYRIGGIDLANGGELSLGGSTAVTGGWAYLLEAQGDSVYAAIGSNAIAQYDFSAAPALAHVEPVMSSPLLIRFGQTQAFASLGYAGVATLPR